MSTPTATLRATARRWSRTRTAEDEDGKHVRITRTRYRFDGRVFVDRVKTSQPPAQNERVLVAAPLTDRALGASSGWPAACSCGATMLTTHVSPGGDHVPYARSRHRAGRHAGARHATEWTVDPAHSTASFTVKHMMVSTVRGEFGKISGTASWSKPDYSDAQVDVTVDASHHRHARAEARRAPALARLLRRRQVPDADVQVQARREGQGEGSPHARRRPDHPRRDQGSRRST